MSEMTPQQREQQAEYLAGIRQQDRRYAEMAMRARAVSIAEAKVYLANPENIRRNLPADIAASKRQLKTLLALDVKAARELAGLTQEQAAALAGISRTALASAEGGMHVPYSIGELERIRELLHRKIAANEGREYVDLGVQTMLARLGTGATVTSTPGITAEGRQLVRDVLAKPMEDGA